MRLRQLLIYLFCLAAGALFATAAAAERRVALVIGNSSYKNATSLPNTINDSSALAAMFKSVGFEVIISRTDLGVVDFKRSVREFLITAESADIAVVYYAGHGIEISGTNYLVPVDARLSRDYDVDDEAVSLDRIVWALQSVRRLRLILLDACRDNPFAAKLRSAGMRAPSRGGLAKIEEVSADTLVAYAAKAGSVSYDGDGVNSPYATALIRHLAEPGLDIRIALGRVRDDVVAMTGGRQEPFIYGSLGGSTIALVAPGAVAKKVEPAAAPAPAAPAPAAVVRRESPAVASRTEPAATTPSPAWSSPRRPLFRRPSRSSRPSRRCRHRRRWRPAIPAFATNSVWRGCVPTRRPTRSRASSANSLPAAARAGATPVRELRHRTALDGAGRNGSRRGRSRQCCPETTAASTGAGCACRRPLRARRGAARTTAHRPERRCHHPVRAGTRLRTDPPAAQAAARKPRSLKRQDHEATGRCPLLRPLPVWERAVLPPATNSLG